MKQKNKFLILKLFWREHTETQKRTTTTFHDESVFFTLLFSPVSISFLHEKQHPHILQCMYCDHRDHTFALSEIIFEVVCQCLLYFSCK
jgi:hypothetical protein